MNNTWTAHAVTMHTRGLAAAGLVALALCWVPSPRRRPVRRWRHAARHAHVGEGQAPRPRPTSFRCVSISAKIYHCVPWVEVKKNAIGFYKPKHMTGGDTRYLSINLYIDQQPSAEFAAYKVEDRASRMFSRYVGPMLRRLASPPA